MKIEIYHISDQPFDDWLKGHAGVQSISIERHLPSERLYEFDVLASLSGATISISDLIIDFANEVIKGAESELEKDLIEEYYWQIGFESNKQLPVLFVLYANKKYGSSFEVTERYIVSADGKTILYVFEAGRELSIEEGFESIVDYACRMRRNLQKVYLPESLQLIGRYAFEECNDLSEVKFPMVMESIGEGAFCDCDFTSVRLPEGIRKIPCDCFEHSFLVHFNIPSTVKVIEELGLGWLNLVDNVIIPEGVEEIGHETFCNVRRIVFPSTLKVLDEYFYTEYQVGDYELVPYIEVHPDNPYFYSKDGTIYRRGETKPYTPFPFNRDKWGDVFDE